MLNRDLTDYNQLNRTPFHMPGHKRQNLTGVDLPYEKDYTEVEGLDDLHHPEGILKAAMERTAAMYGVDRTWYLVGGSTVGNLAGLYALAPYGSEVICTRVMHRSILHGLMLAGYRVHYVMPDYVEELGCYGGVRAEAVKEILKRYPQSKAVILTSPTYEGILSEVDKIVEIAHAAGIPVLVDEAHGSHLDVHFQNGERSDFPKGAVSAGADVVIQSTHKTLLGLTQSAWMHLQGNLVEAERIDEALDIFETSSPSYILMNSLDACTDYIQKEGKALFNQWKKHLQSVEECGKAFHNLELKVYNAQRDGYQKDPSKILIYEKHGRLSGYEIATRLREIYAIETEMATENYCLAMTGPGDTQSSYVLLLNALKEMDATLDQMKEKTIDLCQTVPQLSGGDAVRYSLAEASHMPKENVMLKDCKGRICGEEVFCYPPGIPLVLPGEEISEDMAAYLCDLEAQGKLRHGKKHPDNSITVIKETDSDAKDLDGILRG